MGNLRRGGTSIAIGVVRQELTGGRAGLLEAATNDELLDVRSVRIRSRLMQGVETKAQTN